jgi:DNA-binding NarL/FixJ family response regulator
MYGNEEYYTKMIELGVKGYILKTCHINEFEKAIREVMKGGNYFFTNLKIKNVKNKNSKGSDQILSENSDLTVTEIKLIQNIYLNSSN